MKLRREKLFWIGKRILQAYADYRVTVSALALLTIYGAVDNFLYIFDYEVRKKLLIWKWFTYSEEISVGLLLFICGAMFTESLLPYTKKEKREKTVRFLLFLCAAVIAALVVIFCILDLQFEESLRNFPVSDGLVSRWAGQFALGYALLLLLGTVYLCHKRSGVGFMEYMLHVLVNLCVTTAVYFVLWVGVSLMLTVVDTLFVDSVMGSYATTGAIMLTGLYYVPCCIMALHNMDSDIDKAPGKYLLRDALTGLSICAMVVVYVYLLKILLLWEMPSNELFGIVAGLFCFGMPIWMMDYYYRDETRYMRFVQKLPYGLVPMMPLQIYAMGVRIYEHGMTPSRYMGMFLVIIEAGVLLIWHFRKEKMERVLLFLCACVVIIFFVPGINKDSLSDRWQRVFLENYYHKTLTQGSLTPTELQRLKGAYKYLKYKPEMAALLEQYDIYEESFASKLAEAGADMETYTQLESHDIWCYHMVDSLDVDGYSQFSVLHEDAAYRASEEEKIPVDFSAFRFCKGEDGAGEIVIADLDDFVNRCMAFEQENPDAWEPDYSEAMRPYNKITLSDGSVLYLNEFSVRYEDGIKEGKAYFEIVPESVDISGMLLEKAKN